MKDSFKLKVLDTLIEEFGVEEYPDIASDELFERYAVTEVLKPKSISSDDIEDGIVDGSRDGGVDAVFTFLNGALLATDSDYLVPESEAVKNLQRQPLLEVLILQAKNKTKWDEAVWSTLLASLPLLLDPEVADEDLLRSFNGVVVEKTGIYRRALSALGVKFPRVRASVVYATRAPESNISTSMESIRARLEDALLESIMGEADLSIGYAGVSYLYAKSNENYERVGRLVFDNLIRTEGAYIGTVALRDYLSFLQDDSGQLEQELFEANVRDYEGINRVNKSIASTLSGDDKTEFWWRNNGITILACEASCPASTMTLEQPLIVNGLQTSHVLVQASEKGDLNPDRLEDRIIVRVIVSNDADVRDAVISGTNMQTAITPDSLHASDSLQNDIERYFLAHGWYYERRKNHYKNKSMPASKRVSMVFLAQAIMTLALGEPQTARARPTTLLTQAGGYERVFNDALDCDAYLVAVRIMKEVDAYLKTDRAKQLFDDRTSARYYVALVYYMIVFKITDIDNLHFAENAARVHFPMSAEDLEESLQIVADAFSSFEDEANDKLSKRQVFRDDVLSRVVGRLSQA